MFRKAPLVTFALILLSVFVCMPLGYADNPTSFRLDDVPRIKQMTNYCGPACVSSVFNHFGSKVTQEAVGKVVYDAKSRATSGADMLVYARDNGFAAYSWNSSISDAKAKIASGAPVIVLQQNSMIDTSGHYRVLTGYSDAASKFYVMDPYYDEITELSYAKCESLWKSMGHWAMLIVPQDKDTFKSELGLKNPVLHMDLSMGEFKRKNYDEALKEANMALDLEPDNYYAKSIVGRIRQAMGAGG